MTELPPVPARLRVILAHLEAQLADEETVVTYLRLQRDAVRQALAVAEGRQESARPPQSPRRRPPELRPVLGPAPARCERQSSGFMVEQRRTPTAPQEACFHIDDCTMTSNNTHPISAQDARMALTDARLEACAFCRPDTELGILD
ncbi:DUF6233 domain-containing protein [Streptomyces sp. R35]|uniref:DUF6233 domain-containing protein n=1 Tax=Streptomyces sp. R35 TaxID=3238630 RepID=A0AB39SFW4_9ACTN